MKTRIVVLTQDNFSVFYPQFRCMLYWFSFRDHRDDLVRFYDQPSCEEFLEEQLQTTTATRKIIRYPQEIKK